MIIGVKPVEVLTALHDVLRMRMERLSLLFGQRSIASPVMGLLKMITFECSKNKTENVPSVRLTLLVEDTVLGSLTTVMSLVRSVDYCVTTATVV